jgi:hypothetical protein
MMILLETITLVPVLLTKFRPCYLLGLSVVNPGLLVLARKHRLGFRVFLSL